LRGGVGEDPVVEDQGRRDRAAGVNVFAEGQIVDSAASVLGAVGVQGVAGEGNGAVELEDGSAEDLPQDILLKLFQQFSHYSHDPKRGQFRSWLKTVVNNALTDFWRRQRRRPEFGGVDGTAFLKQPEDLASPKATTELSSAIEDQAQTIAAEILERVRAKVKETTWQAFYQMMLEQRPAAEVAGGTELECRNRLQGELSRQRDAAGGVPPCPVAPRRPQSFVRLRRPWRNSYVTNSDRRKSSPWRSTSAPAPTVSGYWANWSEACPTRWCRPLRREGRLPTNSRQPCLATRRWAASTREEWAWCGASATSSSDATSRSR